MEENKVQSVGQSMEVKTGQSIGQSVEVKTGREEGRFFKLLSVLVNQLKGETKKPPDAPTLQVQPHRSEVLFPYDEYLQTVWQYQLSTLFEAHFFRHADALTA